MSYTRPSIVLILLFVVLFAGFSLQFGDSIGFLDEQYLLDTLEWFGVFAPIVFLGLLLLEVIVAPLPGGVLPVVAVVMFGPVLGVFYGWLGNVLGSTIAFFIARKFGIRIVSYFVPGFNSHRYNDMIEKYRKGFWLLYATPTLPADVLSFVLGVSDMHYKKFLGAISVAFVVRMSIWAVFGDALARLIFV